MELCVQLSQLLQEARVWRDVPVGAHGLDGLRQCHALVDHQVGQDQGGRAAQAHGTVDEHFTCGSAEHKNSLWSSFSSSAPEGTTSGFRRGTSSPRLICYRVVDYQLCPSRRGVLLTPEEKFSTMLQQMFLHAVIPAPLSAPRD